MKNILIFLILFSAFTVKAQLYIDISSGYAIPFLKPTSSMPYQKINDVNYYKQTWDSINNKYYYKLLNSDISNNDLKINFSTGINYSGGLTYFFNKYFGLFASYSYNSDSLSFTKNNSRKHYAKVSNHIDYKVDTSVTNIDYSLNSKTNKLSFGITFQLPFKKYTPYIKGSIGINNRAVFIRSTNLYYYNTNYTVYNHFYDPPTLILPYKSVDIITEKYTGAMSYSYSTSIGIKKNFNNFNLFFETSFNFDKFKPNRGKILDVSLKGQSYYNSVINKGDEITLVENEQELDYPNDPWIGYNNGHYSTKRIKNNYNFSNINFSIGFQYKIPTNKNELVLLNNNFISHLFLEISNGYSFSLQNKELPIPYANNSYNVYLSKDPIYNPYWNSPSHMQYIVEKKVSIKKPVKMNFSTGYNVTSSIGYYINKYLGLSVSYNYNNTQNDFNKKKTETTSRANDYYGNQEGLSDVMFNLYSKNKSYIINGIFQYPINVKIVPYLKAGLSLSKHELIAERTFYSYNSYELDSKEGSKEKYSGNNSIGKILSLGTKYNVYKNFWITAECTFTFDNYSPTKVYLYDSYFIETGVGGLSFYPPPEEIYLQDIASGDVKENDVVMPLFNEYRYKNTFAYSNIRINIGVQYTLGFKEKNEEKKPLENL